MAPGSEEEAELLEAIKPWLEKMVAEGHTWEETEAKLDELCRALFEVIQGRSHIQPPPERP
jgi:hypothetical protein